MKATTNNCMAQLLQQIVCIMVNGLTLLSANSDEMKTLTLEGFLPMTGKGWNGGGACLPAVMMALRHVNQRVGLLDGYNITYHWVDTQVCMYVYFIDNGVKTGQ